MARSSAAPPPSTELRESWTADAIRLWVQPADRWPRWLWLASCAVLPFGVGPALLAFLASVAVPGNVGYIWLIGAASFTGILGLTLSIAVRFEPQDVRLELTHTHIGVDADRIPVARIAAVRFTDDRLALTLHDGTTHTSRRIRPRDADRLLGLIEGMLPGTRTTSPVVPLLARPARNQPATRTG